MESSKKRVQVIRCGSSRRLTDDSSERVFPGTQLLPSHMIKSKKGVPSVRHTGTITRESPGTLQGARRRLLRKGTQLLPTRMIIFGGPNSHLRYSPHNLSPSKMFAGK